MASTKPFQTFFGSQVGGCDGVWSMMLVVSFALFCSLGSEGTYIVPRDGRWKRMGNSQRTCWCLISVSIFAFKDIITVWDAITGSMVACRVSTTSSRQNERVVGWMLLRVVFS